MSRNTIVAVDAMGGDNAPEAIVAGAIRALRQNQELEILLGKAAGIPCTVYQLKYAATVSVGLTFLTVMLFLGPRFGYGAMFQGVNLWFHLLMLGDVALVLLIGCWMYRKYNHQFLYYL